MTFLAAIGLVVLALPLILGLLVLSLMWRAWWLYPAWGWFIVPLGLPDIPFWHFAALVFLAGVLTHHVNTKKDERKTEWATYPVVLIWPVLVWVLLRWMAS